MLWDRAWVFPFTGSMEALKNQTLLERQKLLRNVMTEMKIQAALINLDAMRGGARWFFNETAVGANEEGYALLLPESNGKKVKERAQQQATPSVQRIGDVLHIGSGEALTFHFADVLQGCKRLGVAFLDEMNAEVYKRLYSQLNGIEIVDITTAYVDCRARRNSDDLEHMERSALQHDRLMEEAQTAIRIGRNEPEILNDLKMTAYRNGGSGFSTLYFAGAAMVSAQPKEKVTFNGFSWPGRTIRLYDRVALRMSCNGISGFYGDIARLFVVGAPDEETCLHWHHVLEIQKGLASCARPGTTFAELRRVYERLLTQYGETDANFDFLSGVGYGFEEGPNARFDAIPLCENMTISIHPLFFDETGFPYCVADMFLIKPHGAERLSRVSHEICCL